MYSQFAGLSQYCINRISVLPHRRKDPTLVPTHRLHLDIHYCINCIIDRLEVTTLRGWCRTRLGQGQQEPSVGLCAAVLLLMI